MHPSCLDKFVMLPRRSATLLHEHSDAPFNTTTATRERLRKLMSEPAVQEVIENSIKRPNVGL